MIFQIFCKKKFSLGLPAVWPFECCLFKNLAQNKIFVYLVWFRPLGLFGSELLLKTSPSYGSSLLSYVRFSIVRPLNGDSCLMSGDDSSGWSRRNTV